MITITSFGYLHGPAPEAHITADLRFHFHDPHVTPALRELTAEDPDVIAAVAHTPGVGSLTGALADAAQSFGGGVLHDLFIAVGCAGGRHRSAAVAGMVAGLLRDRGCQVTVTHRDIGKPVVHRTGAA